MKKLTLLLIVLSTSLTYSQIKQVENVSEGILIGKIAPMGNTHIVCKKYGDTYSFIYADVNYQHIDEFKDFSFKDIDGAFDNLYNLIMTNLEAKSKDEVTLELPDGILILKFEANMGIASFQFQFTNNNTISGRSIYMTKRQAQKLFGKK